MKIKNFVFTALFAAISFAALAQDEEEKAGFKKENLFTGGNLTLQFGNRITTLGLSPYFGYSVNKFIDVAASLNFNYTSQRDYAVMDDKVRQTIYGPGTFVRLYPVKFLFAQAQYEFNFIKQRYIQPGYPDQKETFDAHSFLIGGGYAGGREQGSNSFYYFSVLWDIGKNQYSPYKDYLRRAVPIFRAGYNVGLFQGKRRGSN